MSRWFGKTISMLCAAGLLSLAGCAQPRPTALERPLDSIMITMAPGDAPRRADMGFTITVRADGTGNVERWGYTAPEGSAPTTVSRTFVFPKSRFAAFANAFARYRPDVPEKDERCTTDTPGLGIAWEHGKQLNILSVGDDCRSEQAIAVRRATTMVMRRLPNASAYALSGAMPHPTWAP